MAGEPGNIVSESDWSFGSRVDHRPLATSNSVEFPLPSPRSPLAPRSRRRPGDRGEKALLAVGPSSGRQATNKVHSAQIDGELTVTWSVTDPRALDHGAEI